jgi:hypothetical protein
VIGWLGLESDRSGEGGGRLHCSRGSIVAFYPLEYLGIDGGGLAIATFAVEPLTSPVLQRNPPGRARGRGVA